jgi:hypothetical protein
MISKLSLITFFAVAVIGLNAMCPTQNNQQSTINAEIASTTLAPSAVYLV